MKKLLSIVLAVLMVLAMGSVAFADEYTTTTASSSKEATLTDYYIEPISNTGYYFVVTWGEMKFKYEETNWNYETEDHDSKVFTAVDNSNKVTVTSYSTEAQTVTVKCTVAVVDTLKSNVTGYVNGKEGNASDELSQYVEGGTADSTTFTITFSGSLDEKVTKLADVTITFDAEEPVDEVPAQ